MAATHARPAACSTFPVGYLRCMTLRWLLALRWAAAVRGRCEHSSHPTAARHRRAPDVCDGAKGSATEVTASVAIPRCTTSRLRCSCRFQRRLANERRDAQRGDPVLLPTQHAEAEAVEGKGLPGLGDRARFVDDEAGDGGRLTVWQVPLHGAIEIADRHEIGRASGRER